MNKKTIFILVGVAVGGCCLFGTAALGAAMLFGEEPPASAASAGEESVVVEGAPGPAEYKLAGRSTVTAEGFADGLEGSWLLMDGAAVDSIEDITSERVTVRTSRVGELWHYTFDGDGSYVFRYYLSTKSIKAIWVEKGEWSTDGASLTMTPESCISKASGNELDCLEPGPHTYAFSTLELEELTPDSRVGDRFPGLRLTGPFPKWCQSSTPFAYRELQRVR